MLKNQNYTDILKDKLSFKIFYLAIVIGVANCEPVI